MSAYNSSQSPSSIAPGDASVPPIVNLEQLGAGVYSQRIAIQDAYGIEPRPVVVNTQYFDKITGLPAQPGAVEYDIYVAQIDGTPPTNWTKVGSTTNVLGDQVTIQRNAASGNMFRFLCVLEKTTPTADAGGNTVLAVVTVLL